ncbi:MAG TPA: glycosyltransferase, partial [Patescibacteria group bacterium]|nr:glycosyltransferase [Patescibacteria group bacterium]
NPRCYDELFAKGDLFLPVCEAFKNELIEHGCPKEKVKVLHSAIDCDLFYYKKRQIPTDKSVKIISVCRLVAKKGLEYAIHAVAKLIQNGFDIHYTIIGDGILHQSLQKLIIDLNMENYIKLVGRKNITEVVTYLHENHIFLLPSIVADDGDEEGIPNAAKEAMACGLPVILTDHSGNGELVEHGISGLLIEQKSVIALENALSYLVKNTQKWNKFGEAGRKKIEKDFERNKLNKKLYNFLRKVI